MPQSQLQSAQPQSRSQPLPAFPFRARPSALRQPANDNVIGDLPCPRCTRADLVRFDGGEYSGRGLMHHHWHCDACAHDWITVLHVQA